MASIEERSETSGGAAEEAGERLDRVLAARLAELSRSRHKALILAGRVAIDRVTIRDPGHHVNAGDRIVLDAAAAARCRDQTRKHRARGGVRGRGADRHRQAQGPGRASRRRQLDRHIGQCAGRPLRRQPGGCRRRAPARYRAPPRQGHHRADGGRQDRTRPQSAQPPVRRSWPQRFRCAAATWRSSGACRCHPTGTIDKPIGRHPHAREKMACAPAGGRQ